jgi:hypothetical protein
MRGIETVRCAARVVALAAAVLALAAGSAMAVPTAQPTWGTKAQPYKKPDGSAGPGYWIFVCGSAKDAGYKGDLNFAFKPSVDDSDAEFPEGEFGPTVRKAPPKDRFEIDMSDPALPIRRLSGSLDLDSYLDVWDNCNSKYASPSFGVSRRTDQTKPLPRYDFNGDGDAQGQLGVQWRFGFTGGNSLEVERMFFDDDIRSFKTTQTANKVPGWELGWGIARRTLSGDATGDQIRVCRGHGNWADGRWANTWWKNVTSVDNVSSGGGYSDLNFSTTTGGRIASAPFYAAPNADGDPLEYLDKMNGSGDEENPDSLCHIKYDGDTKASAGEWYWSKAQQGIYSITMFMICKSQSPDRDKRCRGLATGSGLQEASKARTNALGGQFIRAYGVRMWVTDDKDPLVQFKTSTLISKKSGSKLVPVTDGTPKEEYLDFDAADAAGLRRLRIQIRRPNGSVVTMRDVENKTAEGEVCDYRYAVPCAGGTGGTNRPAWVPSVQKAMLDPLYLNADDLPPGTYTWTIQAWDGSNRTSTASTSFLVDTNLVAQCTGDIVRTSATQDTCGSTGKVCESVATCNPSTNPATETTPTGPFAPAPNTGDGIFSYTLASNGTANGMSPSSGGGCKVIESVISGSGSGGGLSDREKNQIISVTLDFSGMSELGSSLGTQDLRMTFDLPSRRDSRYRSALGCPG